MGKQSAKKRRRRKRKQPKHVVVHRPKNCPPDKFTPYMKRDVFLYSLGFDSYKEYLASALWMSIKERVYEKRGRQCTLCWRTARYLHHQSYAPAVLLGEDINHILPICYVCHNLVEVDANGRKRPMEEVHKVFRRMRATKPAGPPVDSTDNSLSACLKRLSLSRKRTE